MLALGRIGSNPMTNFLIQRFTIADLLICCCFITITSCAPKGEYDMRDESESIIAETQTFAQAWNQGDAKLAASFYTEDGVRVGAFGDTQTGRAEIEAAYDRLLHQTMPGAKATQDSGHVRMLSEDLAIWQGGLEIIPASGASPLKGHVIQVMKRVNGRWLILEAHPKLFPPSR
jgi:uncharacterized protein (TIGR02246 family)